MDDDAELLRQYCHEGSEASFRDLVDRHVNLVFGAALRRTGGDTHRAQDIVQTVFISLAQHAPALVRHPSITGWLFTTTRNAAINSGIAEQRRQTREAVAGSIEALNAAPSDSVDWNQLRLVLAEALDDLRPGERELVLLRYYQGRTLADVSLRLGIRENAMRMRIERALKRLRHSLRKRGVVSTSAGLATALSAHGDVVAPAGLASAASVAALGAATQSLSGVGLFGTLTLMSIKKALVVAAALAAVGVLTFDFMALRRESQQASANDGTRSEFAKLARRRTALDFRLGVLNRQIALVESAQAEAPAGAGAVATSTPAFVSPTRPYLSDPTWRALYSIQQQAIHHMEFQDFYHELGLQPEQIEKLEAVWVQQDLSNRDVLIARDLGQDEQPINERSGAIWNAGMTEILGPQGKARLEVYLRSRDVRSFVNILASLPFPFDDPLTPAQAARITEIALANDTGYQAGGGTDRSKPNWSAVWQPAADILTPDQLTTLQAMAESAVLKAKIQQTLAGSR